MDGTSWWHFSANLPTTLKFFFLWVYSPTQLLLAGRKTLKCKMVSFVEAFPWNLACGNDNIRDWGKSQDVWKERGGELRKRMMNKVWKGKCFICLKLQGSCVIHHTNVHMFCVWSHLSHNELNWVCIAFGRKRAKELSRGREEEGNEVKAECR